MAIKMWGRFGNLLIDTFRDQIVAEKVSHGLTLYKEVYYLFGVLPSYILALLKMIFGTSLYCSYGLGLVMIAVCSLAMYGLARFYLTRFFSTLLIINFLSVFAFNDLQHNGLFNFVLPYSLASYLAITFVLLSLYFYVRFVHIEDYKDLMYWSIMVYLTFLSRVYIGTPVYIVYFVSCCIFERKRFSKVLPYILAPVVLSVLTYAAYLLPTGAWPDFRESVIGVFLLNVKGGDPFASLVLGTISLRAPDMAVINTLRPNIITMVKVYFSQVSTMCLLFYLGMMCSRGGTWSNRAAWRKISLYLAYAITSVFVISWLRLNDSSLRIISTPTVTIPMRLLSSPDHRILQLTYNSTPLILFSFIVLSAWLYFKKDFERTFYTIIVICAISLVLVFRIFFKVEPYVYGNYLLVPGSIAIFIFFVKGIPWFMNACGLESKNTRFYFIACAIYFITNAFVFMRWNIYGANKQMRCERTEQGIVCLQSRGYTEYFWEAVRYIHDFTPKDSTVLVVPEGVGINYFSKRAAPMRYDEYLPNIINSVGEDKIVKELNSQKIDYVVEIQRTTYEHGYTRFGFDYGAKIKKWLVERYVVDKQIGHTPFDGSNLAGIVIYKRK